MTNQSHGPLNAVHQSIKNEVGAKLFTVLAFRENGASVERIFSSRPEEYPVGGWKLLSRDVAPDWLKVCLEDHLPFLGRTHADIERIFSDAQLISSLGCGSFINVPVVSGGTVVAALNMLDVEGAYDEDSVTKALEISARYTETIMNESRE